jgi:hypothetical protein
MTVATQSEASSMKRAFSDLAKDGDERTGWSDGVGWA